VAADPERKMYGKFASMFIPRTYLIGREGTILYQSVGYDEDEFDLLLAKVKGAI
jgi:peroxiredoxin